MARTIVGILRGGASSEYEHSLKSGAALLHALPEERYDVRDIFIDRKGLWHARGMPTDPVRVLSQIDVILNALHGAAGEDGTVQRILERSGVPFAGARPLAASMSSNKIMAREILERAGVRIPLGIAFSVRDGTTADMAMEAFKLFSPPYIVKPPAEGASMGIIIADSLLELPDAIGDVLDAYGIALVEEFINGEEVSVGVIEDFRKEALYVLPPAHIEIPDSFRYLHADVVRDGRARISVPSRFKHDEKQAIMDAARKAHQALGMSHFSESTIIQTRRGPYLLEVNAHPHLHERAPFHHMLESVGASIKDFAEHAIGLAQKH